jgi:hypothetical protein
MEAEEPATSKQKKQQREGKKERKKESKEAGCGSLIIA